MIAVFAIIGFLALVFAAGLVIRCKQPRRPNLPAEVE